MIPLPSEFEAVVPAVCDGVTCNPSCDEVRRAMIDFPVVMARFVEGWFNDDGSIADEFKTQICALNCGGATPSTSSSSSSTDA